MNQKFINLTICCGAAVLILLAFTGCSSKQKESPKTIKASKELPHDPFSAPFHAAAKKAKSPDFTARLLNGGTFRLSNYRGDVVLLNIWATWCAPCREEAPALESLYKNYKNKGVKFLGISIDKQGKSVVVPFVKKYHVSYPVTIDDGPFLKKYGPVKKMGIPITYIIDQKGYLRYFAIGAVTQKEVKPRIDHLLNGEKDTGKAKG